MTREEIESRLMEKAREIRDLVRDYEPDNAYFDFSIMDGERVSFGNEYWASDKPIRVNSVSLDGVKADD